MIERLLLDLVGDHRRRTPVDQRLHTPVSDATHSAQAHTAVADDAPVWTDGAPSRTCGERLPEDGFGAHDASDPTYGPAEKRCGPSGATSSPAAETPVAAARAAAFPAAAAPAALLPAPTSTSMPRATSASTASWSAGLAHASTDIWCDISDPSSGRSSRLRPAASVTIHPASRRMRVEAATSWGELWRTAPLPTSRNRAATHGANSCLLYTSPSPR